jgi:putative PIN family toxin of toxin-antitoxin system
VTRVVLDANIYVSAAITRHPDAAAARLLSAMIDGRLEALLCPMLLAEVADTLRRPKLKRYLSDEQAAAFAADVSLLATTVADPAAPYPVGSRGPDDDYLLALLAERPGSVLCTGDGDWLELRDSQPILSARDLIERLEDE